MCAWDERVCGDGAGPRASQRSSGDGGGARRGASCGLHTKHRDRAKSLSAELERRAANTGQSQQIRGRGECCASVGKDLHAGRTVIVIVGRSGFAGVRRVTLGVGRLFVFGVCVVRVAMRVAVVVGLVCA